MFARFVMPLLATILCGWEIWSPRIQYITYFPVEEEEEEEEEEKKRKK